MSIALKKDLIIDNLIDGRLNRRQYLFSLILIILFSFGTLLVIIFVNSFLGNILSFLVFLLLFSCSIRRLHDINLSGYYSLFFIIYFVGAALRSQEILITGAWISIFFIIFLLFKSGSKYTNKYGPKPGGLNISRLLLNK